MQKISLCRKPAPSMHKWCLHGMERAYICADSIMGSGRFVPNQGGCLLLSCRMAALAKVFVNNPSSNSSQTMIWPWPFGAKEWATSGIRHERVWHTCCSAQIGRTRLAFGTNQVHHYVIVPFSWSCSKLSSTDCVCFNSCWISSVCNDARSMRKGWGTAPSSLQPTCRTGQKIHWTHIRASD